MDDVVADNPIIKAAKAEGQLLSDQRLSLASPRPFSKSKSTPALTPHGGVETYSQKLGLGRLRGTVEEEMQDECLVLSSVDMYLPSSETLRRSKYMSKVFLKSMHERMKQQSDRNLPSRKSSEAILKANKLNSLAPRLQHRYHALIRGKRANPLRL